MQYRTPLPSCKCKYNHFTLNTRLPVSRASVNCPKRYCQGPTAPFLSVETGTELGDTFVRIEKTSPALRCVDRLLKLLAFTKRESSNISEVIQQLLSSCTNLDIRALEPFIPTQVHGTSTHRLRAHGFRECITPNSSTNKYSCCTFESDTHHKVRLDSADYTINFMAILCFMVESVTWMGKFEDLIILADQFWATITPCIHCYQEVPDENYQLDPLDFDPSISRSNVLLRLSEAEEANLRTQLLDTVNTVLRANSADLSEIIRGKKAQEIVTAMFLDDQELKQCLYNIFGGSEGWMTGQNWLQMYCSICHS